jgi:hypothetical protein
MTKVRNSAPAAGTRGFAMTVIPSRECLLKSIDDNGFCDPTKCWHKVAISAVMAVWAPNEKSKVRVDAGHIKVNYRGWRYVANTPLHVKRSLLLFDKKRYDEVRIRPYTLRFQRNTKIVAVTRERRDQINANRTARIAAGGDERKRNYPNMRKRVEGFSGIV